MACGKRSRSPGVSGAGDEATLARPLEAAATALDHRLVDLDVDRTGLGRDCTEIADFDAPARDFLLHDRAQLAIRPPPAPWACAAAHRESGD